METRTVELRTGDTAVVRPIRAADAPLLVPFHEGLSDRSVYQRYFHMLPLGQRIDARRLARVCAADGTHEAVLVAEWRDAAGQASIAGVCRLTCSEGASTGDFAIVVVDACQGLGVGTALMRAIIDEAARRGLASLGAEVLRNNGPMRRLCQRLGMAVTPTADPQVVRVELPLPASAEGAAQNARKTASDRAASS
jgi:acetyltransferase